MRGERGKKRGRERWREGKASGKGKGGRDGRKGEERGGGVKEDEMRDERERRDRTKGKSKE